MRKTFERQIMRNILYVLFFCRGKLYGKSRGEKGSMEWRLIGTRTWMIYSSTTFDFRPGILAVAMLQLQYKTNGCTTIMSCGSKLESIVLYDKNYATVYCSR